MRDCSTDKAIVNLVQAGDKQSFGLLVTKHQRKLARIIARLVHDPAEVDDLVQETFVKAYQALSNFRGESAFYTWLYRIGINTAKNHLLKRSKKLKDTKSIDDENAELIFNERQLQDSATPEAILASNQTAEMILGAIEELPQELRTAITLREIDGLSYEEIAVSMNSPVGTVRSRIFRAREVVASRLEHLLGNRDAKKW